MRSVLALARKDLRVLTRLPSGMFFTFVWPIVVAVLFGTVFSGQAQRRPGATRIAIVDEDNTDASRAFLRRLDASGDVALDHTARVEATSMVRRGERPAYVVVAAGFGDAAARNFSGPPPHVEVGSDPARQAEASMIEGVLMKHVLAHLEPRLTLTRVEVSRARGRGESAGPATGFDITFPQGIVWGIIGCIMSFTVGLVSERVRGTFVRLQTAPISRAQILAGKALACLATITAVQVTLLALGILAFGVRPASYALLAMACVCASLGFIGFMMMVAGFSRTEQAAGGAGWAMLMPMTLVGGGMMPQYIMPAWMQTAGHASPVKWVIRGIEGALWRNFTVMEMVVPCSMLLVFGTVCFVAGVRALRD